MSRDEIVKGVIQFLHDHKNGSGGFIHQEPYKGDLFSLFAAAFNSGFLEQGNANYLSADALTDIIVAQDPDVTDFIEWDDVRRCWQEWTYAWRHCDQIQK